MVRGTGTTLGAAGRRHIGRTPDLATGVHPIQRRWAWRRRCLTAQCVCSGIWRPPSARADDGRGEATAEAGAQTATATATASRRRSMVEPFGSGAGVPMTPADRFTVRQNGRPDNPASGGAALPLGGGLSLPLVDAEPLGAAGRLDAVVHAELAEDVVEVGAHRLLADEQPLGDLPVGEAVHQQLEHVRLARGEQLVRRRCRLGRRLEPEAGAAGGGPRGGAPRAPPPAPRPPPGGGPPAPRRAPGRPPGPRRPP